jgi:hypothetical protein
MVELMEQLPEVQAEIELLRRAGLYREYADAPLTAQEKRLTEMLLLLPAT